MRRVEGSVLERTGDESRPPHGVAEDHDLFPMYVATQRLHETLNRASVVQAILEIVADLIGCEAVALFEHDEDGR